MAAASFGTFATVSANSGSRRVNRGTFRSDGQTFELRHLKDTIVQALTALCAMQIGGRDAKSGAANAG
jgi:hypothetical protein